MQEYQILILWPRPNTAQKRNRTKIKKYKVGLRILCYKNKIGIFISFYVRSKTFLVLFFWNLLRFVSCSEPIWSRVSAMDEEFEFGDKAPPSFDRVVFFILCFYHFNYLENYLLIHDVHVHLFDLILHISNLWIYSFL